MIRDIEIEMKNGYILIQDIKNETLSSGIYVPDEPNNRFSRVMKTYEGSTLKPGDVIIKPIGRTTPIRLNVTDDDGNRRTEVFDCIREGFVFAKIV